MSISTDEAKRARAKAKRAARKAARKVKVDEAKARDARIKAKHYDRIPASEVKAARDSLSSKGIEPTISEILSYCRQHRPRPQEDQPWTWDSRIKPPEVRQ